MKTKSFAGLKNGEILKELDENAEHFYTEQFTNGNVYNYYLYGANIYRAIWREVRGCPFPELFIISRVTNTILDRWEIDYKKGHIKTTLKEWKHEKVAEWRPAY